MYARRPSDIPVTKEAIVAISKPTFRPLFKITMVQVDNRVALINQTPRVHLESWEIVGFHNLLNYAV